MSSHKYDMPKDKTNPLMYVPIAVIALGIVGWAFSTGIYKGIEEGKKPYEAHVVTDAVEKKAVNVQALAEPTDELIARGKQQFNVLCISCHGTEGLGDGANGQGLNPPPRNFHEASSGWKNGPSVAGMWDTLQNGIPGGSMASYQLTPAEDRMAIIHYVRQWSPDAPEVSEDDIAALPAGGGGGGAVDMDSIETDAPAEEQIAESLKQNIVQVSLPKVDHHSAPNELAGMSGASLYNANCASCHGGTGGGVESAKILTTYPYVRLSVPSISTWKSDQDLFNKTVIETTPGNNIHGFATFTKQDLSDLHDYVRALSAQTGVDS